MRALAAHALPDVRIREAGGGIAVRPRELTPVRHPVGAAARAARSGHRGGVLWLTGLSASGKSTLSVGLEAALHDRGYRAYALDGDNLRNGLCADLGFSASDRSENIRRAAEVAALLADAGNLVITAFISPFRGDRDRARAIIGDGYHEVFLAADLATCEARDPKGLYARARAGDVSDFTGISSPYEAPSACELTIDTAALDAGQALDRLLGYALTEFPLTQFPVAQLPVAQRPVART